MIDVISLGDIIQKVIGGGTPPRTVPEYWDGDISWASVKDLRDGQLDLAETEEYISATGLTNSAANLIPEGTVVICTRMAVGRAVMTKRPTAINQDLKAIFPVQDVDSRYLLFALDRLRPQLESVAVGSTVKGISLQQLRTLKLYVPPLSEQRAIAHILDTLDREIQETSAIIDKLQQVKIGLLDDLLTRGLDENGDLRDPEQVNFKESRLGRIPTSWLVEAVGDLSTVIRGASPRPKGDPRYYNGPVPRLMVEDVTRDGKWVTPKVDSLTEMGARLSRYLSKGDFVVVCSGTVGVPAILAVDACIHDGFLGLVNVDENRVSKDFLYWYFIFTRQKMDTAATHGGVFTNLTTTIMKNTLIPLPPINEQVEIVKRLEALESKIQQESEYFNKLANAKLGLMDDLLTGRVRTTNLDIDAEIDSLR